MSEPLTGLLGMPGEDAGCNGGLAVIAEYVELEVEGRDARELFPGFATHLHNCAACAEDYESLVALVREHQVRGER
ncbi:MAG TPA: hypothetical protein VF073_01085 [Gaiella sp.]